MQHFRLARRWPLLVGGLVLLALLLSPTPRAAATDFRQGETIVIAAGEVIDDDLFVSASTIEINGTVKGDLIASGSVVVINGTVEGSTAAGGQSVSVNGTINGSLYTGGYDVQLNDGATIGRNLYFGGFSLGIHPGATVQRDVLATGYQVQIDGNVEGDVLVSVSALAVNGRVGGDLRGGVSSATGGPTPPMLGVPDTVTVLPPGLDIGSQSTIGGNMTVAAEQVSTGVDPEQSPVQRIILPRLGEFLAIVIVGGLLLRFGRGILEEVVAALRAQVLPGVGWGCVTAVAVPFVLLVAAVVVFLTTLLGGLVTFGQLVNELGALGGVTIAFALVTFLVFVSIITKVIVSQLVGDALLDRFAAGMAPGLRKRFLALVVGALLYELLRAVPILGPAVALVTILLGLGAIWLTLRERRRGFSRKSAQIMA